MTIRRNPKRDNQWNKWTKGKYDKRAMADRQSHYASSVLTKVPEDIEQLWTDFKAVQPADGNYNGDTPASQYRNQLVETYLPLVKYNAKRLHARLPADVELDDLVSAGVFGLMDAVDAFDLSRGVKFETYCVPRIRGAMFDELRTIDWVPRLVRSHNTKYDEVRTELSNSTSTTESVSETAVHERLVQLYGQETADKIISERFQPCLVSLQKKWYETDSYKDIREIDILEDKKAEDPTQRLSKLDFLRLATKGLNRNERLIVIMYYYQELKMKEISAALDLSESRISQMHSSIVERLQNNSNFIEYVGHRRVA